MNIWALIWRQRLFVVEIYLLNPRLFVNWLNFFVKLSRYWLMHKCLLLHIKEKNSLKLVKTCDKTLLDVLINDDDRAYSYLWFINMNTNWRVNSMLWFVCRNKTVELNVIWYCRKHTKKTQNYLVYWLH